MIESIDPFLQGHSKEFVPNNPSGNHKLSRNAGLRTASDLQKKTITVNDDYTIISSVLSPHKRLISIYK